MIAAGIGLVAGVDATAAVVAGTVLLGMGNWMATLAAAGLAYAAERPRAAGGRMTVSQT